MSLQKLKGRQATVAGSDAQTSRSATATPINATDPRKIHAYSPTTPYVRVGKGTMSDQYDQPYPLPPTEAENPFLEAKPNGKTPHPPDNPAPVEGRAAKLRKKRASSTNPEGGVSNDGKVQTKLEVRTPNKKWWYRAHREAEYQIPVDLLVIEGGRDEGVWLLEPDVEFSDELSQHIVPANLTRCITSDGTEFLFLAKQTEKSPRSSTRRLVTEARERWIQSTWNGISKSYDFRYASQLRREPTWPEKTMDELLDLGFDGYIINNPNHEVVNRLLWPDDEDGVSQ